jgi:hypothetical protein
MNAAKLLQVAGLLLQLLGAWFLCRVFYQVRALKFGRTEPWNTRLLNRWWDLRMSKIGTTLFWAKGLPWEERRPDIELTADPNATFAFVLILLGALGQIVGALLT